MGTKITKLASVYQLSCGSNTTICTQSFLLQNNNCIGCVVYNRAMFYKSLPPKTTLTDNIMSVQVTKQLKYLGPVEQFLIYSTICEEILMYFL